MVGWIMVVVLEGVPGMEGPGATLEYCHGSNLENTFTGNFLERLKKFNLRFFGTEIEDSGRKMLKTSNVNKTGLCGGFKFNTSDFLNNRNQG